VSMFQGGLKILITLFTKLKKLTLNQFYKRFTDCSTQQFILHIHVYLSILEDAHHGAFKQVKPTYVRTWGLKRGEGIT